MSEECFDIVDEDGKPTGEKKLRSEVHKDGDWHRAVHIWVVNSKNEILLQLRRHDVESHPGYWDISAAGHIAAGDDSLASAQRELAEELGMVVDKGKFQFAGTVKHFSNPEDPWIVNNEFDDVYIVQDKYTLADFKPQAEEVAGLKRVSFTDFKKMVQAPEKYKLVPHNDEYRLLIAFLEKKDE